MNSDVATAPRYDLRCPHVVQRVERKVLTLRIGDMNASNLFLRYLSADEIRRILKKSEGILRHQLHVIKSPDKTGGNPQFKQKT